MTEQYLVHSNFKDYDPKITTPPGLYIIGFLFGKLLEIFSLGLIQFKGGEDINTIRYLNSCILWPLNLFILIRIFQHKLKTKESQISRKQNQSESKAIL